MEFARVTLLVIHVAAAAVAFAIALGASGTLKRARSYGREAFLGAALDYRRRDMMTAIAWVLVLITGFALIFVAGGFKVMPPQYHAANGLVILAVAFGFFFMRPAASGLVAAAEANDVPRADTLIKRVAMGSGILQLTWVVLLVLMFWHLVP